MIVRIFEGEHHEDVSIELEELILDRDDRWRKTVGELIAAAVDGRQVVAMHRVYGGTYVVDVRVRALPGRKKPVRRENLPAKARTMGAKLQGRRR